MRYTPLKRQILGAEVPLKQTLFSKLRPTAMDPICNLLIDPDACVPPSEAQAAQYLQNLARQAEEANPAKAYLETFAHAPLSADVDAQSAEAQLDWPTIFSTLQQTFIEATLFACGTVTNSEGEIVSFQEQQLSGSFLVLKEEPQKAVLFHIGTGAYLNPSPRQWVEILAGGAPCGVLFTSLSVVRRRKSTAWPN